MKKLLLFLTLALSLNFAQAQSNGFACNDSVPVSVGFDICTALITPDMIMEGTYDYNNFEVRIYNEMPNPFDQPGDVANPVGLGTYVVGIFEIGTNNNCWSTIEVLDKMPPTIECACPEGGAFPVGTILPVNVNGEFSATDNSADIPVDCWALGAGALGLGNGGHYYDVYAIEVSANGLYTFTGSAANGGLILGVFDTPFDENKTCQQTIADLLASYAEVQPLAFNNTAALVTGVTYYVVLSDLDVDYIGDYTFSVLPPQGEEVIFAQTVYADSCVYTGCFEDGVNYNFVLPEYFDNCSGADLTFVETVTDGSICGTFIVNRVYTVTDGAGMSATCSSDYFFEGVDISNLTWPTNWDGLPGNNPMLECNTGFAVDAQGNPSPSHTGYPDGYSDACNTIEVFYNDQVYTQADGVPCGTKILRYWTVVDDCTGLIYEYIQIIRITDNTEPTFTTPADVLAKTKGYECNSDVEVPAIEHLSDNCDASPRWWVTTTVGVLVGDTNDNGFVDAGEIWEIANVPLGEYEMCYHAIDNCGNEAIECIIITVFDGVPPIPVCEQHKQVSITAMGNAKVFAYSFDSGSFDNCNPVYFKALRVDDDLNYDGGCPDLNNDRYDDDVFFCCDDVDNSVMVSLRVFDVDPGTGPIAPNRMTANGDLYGHYNDCWSIVYLECKIPPVLDCPSLTVTCEESLDPAENPRLLPNVISVCGYELDYTDKRDLGVCGANIVRTWTATGCNESSKCKQKISVDDTERFNPCTINFPADVTADCADVLGNGGEPIWDENPCNVVAAEFKDDTFKFVDGACYKIVRHWAVIDWCLYEPNVGAEHNIDGIIGRKLDCKYLVEDGYYRYTQILMVTDFEVPVITADDECFGTLDCYAEDLVLTASATDECNVDQKFNWKYIVTNMDTWETVQFSYNYTPRPVQGVSGSRHIDNLDRTKYASLKLINDLPIGNYRVTWTVGDGCGNAASKNQFFTVADKKAPTPIMVDLATAVMANGMVELKARSFDKGGCDFGCLSSRDNCTPKTGLYFTFTPFLPRFDINPLQWQHQLNQFGMNFFDPATGLMSTVANYEAGNADAWLAAGNTSQRRYLCTYAQNSNYSKFIDIYVWDQFAYNDDCDDENYDFATVEVNFNHCSDEPNPLVAGSVSYANNSEAFEGMEITADDGETTVSVNSNVNGSFGFNLTPDNYTIQGSTNVEYLNGVTTLDLVIIQKYLLGLKDIDSPYKLIAADANNNGSISASDLLEIRMVILGSKNDFANNSWVAISKDYQFQNPLEAEQETANARVKDITVGSENISNLDFIAVKIGDINGSASSIESRSGNSINLILDDINISKDELVEVPFYAKDFNNVFGAQFTMNVANLNVQDIKSGALTITESNINIVDNNLILSWNDANGVSALEGDVLFTLTIKSNIDTKLSNILNINDNIARAEAYTGSDLEINSISLEYRNTESIYTLYQNQPNPFTAKTEIGFNLATESEYTLTVYDVTGKVMKIYKSLGQAGYNNVEISNEEINTTGVLYYRLESEDFTATKKMILIK